MENTDIFGKYANHVPDLKTVKTLERRKKYILGKLEQKIEESSYYLYLIQEIRALEKTIKFLTWMQNNTSNDMVKGIIEQYKKENAETAADEELVDEEGAKTIGIFHERFNKKYKLEIVLSINQGVKFVTMREIRQKKDKMAEEETEKYRITLHKLERVLRRANEIENIPDTKPDTKQENSHAEASNLRFARSQRKEVRVVVRVRSMI